MLNVDGSVFVHWPPLIPIMIAGLLLISKKLLILIPLMSSLLFSWAIYIWVKELKLNIYFQLLALCLSIFNFAISYTSPMLWSDLLFLGTLLLWIFSMRKNHLKFVLFGFIAMSFMRYSGLFFLPLLLFYFYKRGKFKESIASLILCLFPISLWLIYTYSTTGEISGNRIFPSEFYTEHLKAALLELGRWVFPAQFPFVFHIVGAALVLFLPLWLVRSYSYVILAHLSYALAFIATYLLFDMQEPDARLLLPLVPAFIFSLILLLKKSTKKKTYWLMVLLLLVSSYSIARGCKNWFNVANGEYGKYQTEDWDFIRNSNLCDLVSQKETLISNDAYGVNHLCDKTCLIWPKDRHFTSKNHPEKGTFIWFRQQDPYRIYTATAILSVYKTDTVEVNEDWILMNLEAY